MRTSPPIAALLTLAWAAASLGAQQDVEFGRRGSPAFPAAGMPAPKPAATNGKRGAGAAGERPSLDPDAGRRIARDTGEKIAAEGVEPGLRVVLPAHGQCRFEVSVAPRKLMPGQTGTAKLVMVLEADSVLESATALQIVPVHEPEGPVSLLTLGTAVVQPPGPSHLAAAYRGRHVYDNCVVVELPVTMATDAPLGSSQAIGVEATFRLHEGATGRLLGEYGYPLQISCEVGSVPDPIVNRTTGGIAAGGSGAPATPADTPAGAAATAARAVDDTMPGAAAAVGEDLDAEPTTASAPAGPPPVDDDGSSLLVVGAMVAVAAFALVATLARRR